MKRFRNYWKPMELSTELENRHQQKPSNILIREKMRCSSSHSTDWLRNSVQHDSRTEP